MRICKTTDENNQKEEDDIEFLFPVVHFILVENVLAVSSDWLGDSAEANIRL